MAERVLVGLSGGVDSAYSCRLLQKQGYEVTGVYLLFSDAHLAGEPAARKAAAELNIPYFVSDVRPLFEREVIGPFCDAYAGRKTPNPCIFCNPTVKFPALLAEADKLGIEKIATGHYAQIKRVKGRHRLAKAVSLPRDQSYMLYRLPEDILSRLLLPLGAEEKEAVRRQAAQAGLSSAEAPDSQEICFIPDDDYVGFLRRRGFASAGGQFIGPGGQSLGTHAGQNRYTAGQRRRLGVSYSEPLYVCKLLENGDVQLGSRKQAEITSLAVDHLVRADGNTYQAGQQFSVKVRSTATPEPTLVTGFEEGVLSLQLQSPVLAPAPGQSAVFYDGDLVLGGGYVRSTGGN